MIGQTLSHYRITQKLGAGGMGEVYRAEDMNLSRHVAIKVLPDEFTHDAERLARFQREAQVLASMNHPNIATLYGLEESEGKRFIVMELVEGQTLARRLLKGALPVDEAVEVCRQIAEGVEAAHEKGIIHRDLKPSNVMLTSNDKVKVLDFGLAKSMAGESPAADATHSPTITESMTRPGVILGTAAYMSPEQARGKAVDKRTDVWAFGCVLYECLTARKAFEGETLTETVAAILRDEPDWNALPASTPLKVADLAHRCLRKDLKARFRDIGDARIELEEAKAATFDRAKGAPTGVRSDRQSTPESGGVIRDVGQGTQPRPATEHKKKRPYVWAVAAISVVIVVVASIYWISRREPRESEPVLVPVSFTTYAGMARGASFSPDGNQVAFFWNGEKQDNWNIYIKQIGNESPRRLTTDPHDDAWPAWSPDGQSIAFLRWYDEYTAAVMLMPPIGGRERRLMDVGTSQTDTKSLSWHPGGKWLAVSCDQESKNAPAAIYLISTETREKRRLTSPPRGVKFDSFPAFSPDGRTLAFARYVRSSSEIFLLRVSADLTPEGEPKQLTFMNQDTSFPAWTRDGKELVFASGSKSPAAHLWRVPASGLSQPRILPYALEGGVDDVAVALNKERLIYGTFSSDQSVWRLKISNLDMKSPEPQKFLNSTRLLEGIQYSPDGRSVAYDSWATGSEEVWVCDGDGRNPLQLTHLGGPMPQNPYWSPDGQQIIFQLEAQGNSDLYSVPAQGGQAIRVTSAPSNEVYPCYSRNGRWIYFASDRTGYWQIWKMPAEGGEAYQITRNGGLVPEESTDGKTLFYAKRKERGGLNDLMELWEVPVARGEESKVLEDVGGGRHFNVKQRGIYFASMSDQDNTPLLFYDFKSRKSKVIANIQHGGVSGFTVSPDDQAILYVLLSNFRINLMLVENFR